MTKSRATLPIVLLLVAFLGVFLIYPVGVVLVRAFYADGKFRTDFIMLVFADPDYREALLNSFMIAGTTTLLTFAIAVPCALLMARFDFAGKWLWQGLLLAPLVLPPFVGAIGMKQIFGRWGAVNILLDRLGVVPLKDAISWFDFSFFGVVILEALHLFPILYLNLVAAVANVDPALEEAATNMGASRLRTFLTVTLPLSMPGIFAGGSIVFIWSFTDLGTPLIFDYNRVIPVQIFNFRQTADNPMGYALVLLTIVVSAALFYASRSWAAKRRAAMFSRGHTGRRTSPAGPLGTLAAWAFLTTVVVIAVMPHIGVVLTSVAKVWGYSPADNAYTILPSAYTTEYFTTVFENRLSAIPIKNSLLYSAGAMLISASLGVLVGYVLNRTRVACRGLLDTLTMMPFAIPGVVIAFGYIACFSGTRLDPLKDPTLLLIVAYAVRRLPFMVRSASAGFEQTSVTLEEAAMNLGASPLRSMWDVTRPLVSANLLAGAILVFAFSMLEVSDSLILAMTEESTPITKAIYTLSLRIGDGAYVASAMGVLGMLLLVASFAVATRMMGKRLGEVFRAG